MKKIFIFLWMMGLLFNGFGQNATLVKDIYPGGSGIVGSFRDSRNDMVSMDNILYFVANNSTQGKELWRSDGTEIGTYLVKDINKGDRNSDSYPSNFFVYNNILLFTAYDGIDNRLWKSDGTESGTVMIMNQIRGNDINPLEWAIVNKKLTFWEKAANNIWQTDGTINGTKKIIELRSSSELTAMDDYWFFVRDYELWKTDGTELGTVLVKDINPFGNSNPRELTNIGGTLYFTADNGINGHELWKSDGSSNGTEMVKDVTIGGNSSGLSLFTKHKGVIYFENLQVLNGGYSSQLWKTDGTSNGTKLINRPIGNLWGGIEEIKPVGDFVYYFYRQGTMFRTEGSIVQEIKFPYSATLWYPTTLLEKNGKLLFLSFSSWGKSANTYLNEVMPSDTTAKVIGYDGRYIEFFSINKKYSYLAGQNVFVAGDGELYKFSLCNHSAKINTPNGTSFCTGGSVSINGEATGTTNPFTFKWRQGTSDLGTATSLTVSKAGTYILEVTDSGGCIVSASIDITLTANLPVSISGTNNFCTGQNTTLTAMTNGGVAPLTYQWKQGTSNIGTNANTLSVISAGTYSVGVTDKNGCTGNSISYSVTQKISPNVTVTKNGSTDLLPNSTVLLSVITATGQTYQWSKNGIAISGATSNSYTANSAGSYTVTIIGNGCSATSEAVVTNLITAIEEDPNSSEIQVEVSPNPTQEVCRVKIDLLKPSKVTLQIKDVSGKSLQEQTFSNASSSHDATFKLNSYPTGLYLLLINVNNVIIIKKVIKY